MRAQHRQKDSVGRTGLGGLDWAHPSSVGPLEQLDVGSFQEINFSKLPGSCEQIPFLLGSHSGMLHAMIFTREQCRDLSLDWLRPPVALETPPDDSSEQSR